MFAYKQHVQQFFEYIISIHAYVILCLSKLTNLCLQDKKYQPSPMIATL